MEQNFHTGFILCLFDDFINYTQTWTIKYQIFTCLQSMDCLQYYSLYFESMQERYTCSKISNLRCCHKTKSITMFTTYHKKKLER